jgi:photosystem II stability/assembly factor-like uncharacterized protein
MKRSDFHQRAQRTGTTRLASGRRAGGFRISGCSVVRSIAVLAGLSIAATGAQLSAAVAQGRAHGVMLAPATPPGLAPPPSAIASPASASPGSPGTRRRPGKSQDSAGPAGHSASLSMAAARLLPAAGAVPASFEPASASFRSAASGVVLGAVRCRLGRACAARLVATTDGGAHWSFLNTPCVRLPNPRRGAAPSNVTGVVFASRQNGWLYGPALWSTRDGGAHWRKVSLGGAVSQIAASADTVYAVVAPPGGRPGELFASPAGRSAWARVGHFTGSTLAVHGRAAWFGTSSHLWATADGAHWHKYPFRCPAPYTVPGGGLAGITAASPSDVSFLCLGNAGAGNELKAVLTSVDGGRIVHLAGPAPVGGSGGVIAVPPHRPKVITLDRTANGGRTWTGTNENTGGAPWNSLSYSSRTVGWAEFGQPPYGGLLRTTDTGHTWLKIRF